MKKGAILASSIVLVEKIIFSEYKAKSVINTFFRKNKFAGSKDKILIRELVFKFLKNYFTLQEICKNNLINFLNISKQIVQLLFQKDYLFY